MKKHEELQKEYEEAIESDDEDTANACLAELKLMEGVYKVSFSIFDSDEMIPS